MSKKIIVVDKTSRIITNILDSFEVKEEGFLAMVGEDEFYIGYIADCDVYENIDVVLDIDLKNTQEYLYTVDQVFVKNPDYIKRFSTDEKVKQLESELLNTKLALVEVVEQQQSDKLEAQLALAEVIETIEGGTIV